MNILQISSASSFGGGERYVADLTNSLTDRGHTVYAALRPRSPLIQYLRLPEERVLILPLRNALDVQSAHALDRFVRRRRIEVLHAHMARDYSLASYAARRNRQTKFIATRHVLFELSRLHRHTLSRAARVIAVSQAVAKELRSQGIVEDGKIATVPNGIDVDRFARACAGFDRAEFLRRMGLPVDCALVGSVGELRTLKRHDDFIRAAARVAGEFPEAHFVLAGVDASDSGDLRRQLERLVGELELRERFHFLGWVDEAEALLCAMDVFVSASETESFGLAIVEAMAAGTAVVATRTEGAQEVIDDQKTGLLVPVGDIEGIAAGVCELLANPERRREIGACSQNAANARFSLNRMVDEIEKIYLG